ncbi:MAG: hypothetical protein R3E63_08135 [Pseudomonadales bacterium]
MVVESSRSFDVGADDLGHGTIELKAWFSRCTAAVVSRLGGVGELMR